MVHNWGQKQISRMLLLAKPRNYPRRIGFIMNLWHVCFSLCMS
ncbi:hypothetical protein AKJ16_DCAP14521 [Drosera capensis]